jgi:hypothetical protein
MLCYAEAFQCAAMPLRPNDIKGPVFASSFGRCGARIAAPTTPGVIDSLPLEDFDVNPLRRHAQGCERLFHVCLETSRPAKVDIRISWEAHPVEYRSRQVTGSVEILTGYVPGSLATLDVASDLIPPKRNRCFPCCGAQRCSRGV